MAEAATNHPIHPRDGQTWIGDPPPWQPYVPGFPDPYPVVPQPTVYPLTWPTIGTTTTTFRIRSKEDEQRIAELEALLALAHGLLLAGDDDESLALCELIEDAGILP